MWLYQEIVESRINKLKRSQSTKIYELKWSDSDRRKPRTVVPVIDGALGAPPKDLEINLRTMGLDKIAPSQNQKAALLETVHIPRK